MEMTGGEALASQLVREGVTDIFGVPGVQLDYAIDGLAQVTDRITFRHTRHEQAAAYMADGHARTTGKIGVCMVVPAPECSTPWRRWPPRTPAHLGCSPSLATFPRRCPGREDRAAAWMAPRASRGDSGGRRPRE
jgi:hypothetical protein